jgi:hypothetical protein
LNEQAFWILTKFRHRSSSKFGSRHGDGTLGTLPRNCSSLRGKKKLAFKPLLTAPAQVQKKTKKLGVLWARERPKLS